MRNSRGTKKLKNKTKKEHKKAFLKIGTVRHIQQLSVLHKVKMPAEEEKAWTRRYLVHKMELVCLFVGLFVLMSLSLAHGGDWRVGFAWWPIRTLDDGSLERSGVA